MRCHRCGSQNINSVSMQERKAWGCFGAMINFCLIICTGGLWLIIKRIFFKKSKSQLYFVCNNCGHKWKKFF